jgi:hypothetical protein
MIKRFKRFYFLNNTRNIYIRKYTISFLFKISLFMQLNSFLTSVTSKIVKIFEVTPFSIIHIYTIAQPHLIFNIHFSTLQIYDRKGLSI